MDYRKNDFKILMTLILEPLFEKSKRNLQSSYEKFQPKSKYSSTTSKTNYHTEFISNEEPTWRPPVSSGQIRSRFSSIFLLIVLFEFFLLRTRITANPSVNNDASPSYGIERMTSTRLMKNGEEFASTQQNKNEMSPTRSLEQFLYSKSYIDQIKVSFFE